MREFSFSFADEIYMVQSRKLVLIAAIVGMIGGIYGIGGGAIMAPFLISFLGLPIYAIAGASLFATFLTSLAGVAFYSLLAWLWNVPSASPDWLLGFFLGMGGMGGMYCGAALQKYIPAKYLRLFLFLLLLAMGIHYTIKACGA